MTHSLEPASSQVESFVDVLRGEAEPDAPVRTFSVDPVQARRKLSSRLADPYAYVLLLIRAAGRLGATVVDITLRRRTLELRFDGRSLGGVLEQSMAAPFHTGEETPEPGLRELGLGLGIAVESGLGFLEVSVTSPDPQRDAEAERLTLVPGAEDRTERVPNPGPRSRITLRGAPVRGAPRPEEELLRQRCRYAGFHVRLNGELLSQGIALGDTIAEAPFGADGVQGIAGFLPLEGDDAEVRFVRDGVWVASHPLDAGPFGFVAVVEAKALRTDLSETDVVRDDAYDAVITAVCDAHARAIAAQDVAALARASLTDIAAERLARLNRSLWHWRLAQFGIETTVCALPFAAIFTLITKLLGCTAGQIIFMLGVAMVCGLMVWFYEKPIRYDPVGPRFTRLFDNAFPPWSRLRRVAFELSSPEEGESSPYDTLWVLMKQTRDAGLEATAEPPAALRPARPLTPEVEGAARQRRQQQLADGLYVACKHDDETKRGTVERLLAYGAPPDVRGDHRRTALFQACRNKRHPIMKILLAAGANPDLANDRGVTPLMLACDDADLRALLLLVEGGADLEAADDRSFTPLLHMATKDEVAVIGALLTAGADVHARDDHGRTPLMLAAKYGREKNVELLLVAESDPTAVDGQGRTALDYAHRSKEPFAAELLEAAAEQRRDGVEVT